MLSQYTLDIIISKHVFLFSATVATVPFDLKAYDERTSTITAITKDFHEIAKTIDSVQTKVKQSEVLIAPEISPKSKNSPSTKSKKRSLKSKLYEERCKRMKQDKAKTQYEESDSQEDVTMNGKIDSTTSCNIQEEETEITKIQRDLAILNQQIKDDLEARKKKKRHN